MTELSTRHLDHMRQLERLNTNITATMAEEIEHADISTPRREEDTHVMREVEAGTFKRVNAARQNRGE